MTYEVEVTHRAQKEIKKLSRETGLRIAQKLREISTSPYDWMEKLKDEEGYKVREGDYRIFIDINKENKKITALRVRHRKNAYK